jgi:hypothetical protein
LKLSNKHASEANPSFKKQCKTVTFVTDHCYEQTINLRKLNYFQTFLFKKTPLLNGNYLQANLEIKRNLLQKPTRCQLGELQKIKIS